MDKKKKRNNSANVLLVIGLFVVALFVFSNNGVFSGRVARTLNPQATGSYFTYGAPQIDSDNLVTSPESGGGVQSSIFLNCQCPRPEELDYQTAQHSADCCLERKCTGQYPYCGTCLYYCYDQPTNCPGSSHPDHTINGPCKASLAFCGNGVLEGIEECDPPGSHCPNGMLCGPSCYCLSP